MEQQPGQNEHDHDNGGPAAGIFDRINNYVLLLYAVACFLMYFSIAGLLVIRGNIILSFIVPGIIAFIIPLIMLSRRFSLSFTREFRVEAPDAATAALVLVAAGCAILPVDAISSFVERRYPPDAEYISFLLSIKPKGILALVATGFGTVIITPFGEELLFRGFIQRIFQRNMQGYLAVILTSLLFGLCHFSLVHLPGIILLGALFGYIFLRTGNVVYPAAAHAVYNLSSLIRLYTTPDSAIESPGTAYPPIPWTILSIVLLGACIRLIGGRGDGPDSHGQGPVQQEGDPGRSPK